MKGYSSTNIDDFRGVWVFCEQRQGQLSETNFELISEGRKLADELGVELVGLLLGDDIKHRANEFGGYGADRVLVCESPMLKNIPPMHTLRLSVMLLRKESPKYSCLEQQASVAISPEMRCAPSHRTNC